MWIGNLKSVGLCCKKIHLFGGILECTDNVGSKEEFLLLYNLYSIWGPLFCCNWFKVLFFFLQEGETDKEEPERPGVIVSNHVSYLDILYHMSASFPSFVAKVSC